MALPKNVDDLLVPAEVPPLTHDWNRQFAPYSWCRLAGFPERINGDLRAAFQPGASVRPLLHKDGTKRLKDTHLRAAAAQHVPNKWKVHPDYADLEWERPLGKAQIESAINGDAIPFDRACLVVAAVDLLFQATGHAEKSVRDYVRIAPAIFYLDQFDKRFFESHFGGMANRTNLHTLIKLTMNSKPQFFEDLARGCGATYTTLSVLDTALRQHLKTGFSGSIAPFPERRHGMRPAAFEVAMFPVE